MFWIKKHCFIPFENWNKGLFKDMSKQNNKNTDM